MTSEQFEEILGECRKLAEAHKSEFEALHSEMDGLAAMLKHGFEEMFSKEDGERLEREISALNRHLGIDA